MMEAMASERGPSETTYLVQDPRVYVVLRNTFTVCSRCGGEFPTELRRMKPGQHEYRNQPQCPGCR